MTTLDKQALEKAIEALIAHIPEDIRDAIVPRKRMEKCAELAVAAYFAALPEAQRRYMSRRGDGSLGVLALAYPQSVKNYIEVEIREVRQP